MGLRGESLIAFGPFEFNESTGELTKAGIRVRLQDQPRSVLLLLLARQGQVVERDEIRTALWADDTHVDFDRGINAAIGRLRQILCDRGARPVYIERVRKRGYRFIAPVTSRPLLPGREPPQQPSTQSAHMQGNTIAPRPAARPSTRNAVLWTVLGFVLLVPLLYSSWPPKSPFVVRTFQLTSDGRAKSPRFVTDGTRLYVTEFLDGATRLFQVPVGGGTPELLRTPFTGDWPEALDAVPERGELMVTTNRGLFVWSAVETRIRRISDTSCEYAKWAPDHLTIACGGSNGLELMDANGSARKTVRPLRRIAGLVWRPDGKVIRYAGVPGAGGDLRMHDYDLTTGTDSVVADDAIGEAVPGVFVRNGWHVYASAVDHNLYAVRASGSPVALTRGPIQYYSVTANPSGDMLYALGEVRRGELMRFDAAEQRWQPFLGGRSADAIAWSPTGDYLAYVTYPDAELWRSRIDGSDALQLTSHPVQAYHPSWSPDGKWLAYSATASNGVWRVFVTTPNGGPAQELAPEPNRQVHQRDPVWSPDGRKIAFSCTGDLDQRDLLGIYIADVKSKQRHLVPGTDGLFSPRWAPDSSGFVALDKRMWLVRYDFDSKLIRILANQPSGWPRWSADARFISFLAGSRQTIARVRANGGPVEDITKLPFLSTGNTFSGTWDHNFYLGFGPDDGPIALRDRGTSELYGLTIAFK